MLMVQSNPQVPMNRAKLKGPPPVPPRPNHSAVVEALAKTRKAAADSKSNIPKSKPSIVQKSKTLDKNTTPPSVSPKINGLARVKSFIRDVINSSDEKRSSLQLSKKSKELSSSNSSVSTKSSPESAKALKASKQSLVRSLSTSMKLEQDSKRVTKSNSFAEKSLPIRKAPPPPLSPKPKLRQLKQYPPPNKRLSGERTDSLQKRNSLNSNKNESVSNDTAQCNDKKPEIVTEPSPKAVVITNSTSSITLNGSQILTTTSRQGSLKSNKSLKRSISTESNRSADIDKTSAVTDMLITEILASQNKTRNNSEKSDECDLLNEMNELLGSSLIFNDSSDTEAMKDLNNHEKLIYELQFMKKEDFYQSEYQNVDELSDTINEVLCEKISDEEAHLYACNIDDELRERLQQQLEIISRMPLPGLPPLPKCLSGFTINKKMDEAKSKVNCDDVVKSDHHSDQPHERDMDAKLALLKKEMAELRSLDLSLLSELWSLSESMISWRHQLERSPRLRPAPPPPPPPART